jgi:ATP-binding cassette subfamily B protein
VAKKPYFIKQRESADCGAACLAAIAGYYKLFLSMERIREACGADYEGITAYGLLKAAEQMGFSAKAVKGGKSDFTNDLPLPLIAHIHTPEGLLHFVVIWKISKHRTLVGDPGKGVIEMPTRKFLKQWTGILIILAPSQAFKPQGKPVKSLDLFYSILKPHKGLLANIIFSSLLYAAAGMAGALFFKILFDEIVPNGLSRTLGALTIGLAVLYIFKALLALFRGQLLLFLGQRLNASLIFGLYEHMLKLPAIFFTSRKNGDIMARFNDVSKVLQAVSTSSITILIDAVLAAASAVLLYQQSSNLFLISLLMAGLCALLGKFFAKPMKTASEETMRDNGQVSSLMSETLTGMESIKALTAERRVIGMAETRFGRLLKSSVKEGQLANSSGALTEAVVSIGTMAVLWFGAMQVLDGTLSVGGLLACDSLLSNFITPVQSLISIQPDMAQSMSASERLSDILGASPETDDSELRKAYPSLRGPISIRGLVYRHGTNDPCLKNFGMYIPAGSKVAIVGESGCGKTTLAKLLVRFYPFEKGEISINGYGIQDINLEHLRKRLVYIPQSSFFFSGPISSNLRVGADGATMEELIAASQIAMAHSFISELPYRYETMLDENAQNLSMGQRQRLSIAQAVLRRPDILVLDETASGLDEATEMAVMQGLNAAFGDITIISITHRLLSAIQSDCIFVMSGGRIAEAGKHHELLAQRGLYAKLWSMQRPEAVI